MKDVIVLYISGPMSGYENFNYEAFQDAADYFRGLGFVVIDPSEKAGGAQGLDHSWYITQDLMTIMTSVDAVVVLPGWEDSAGACAEVVVAKTLGIPVVSYREDEVVHCKIDAGFALEPWTTGLKESMR